MTEGPPSAAPPSGGADGPTAERAETVVARPGSHRAQRSPLAAVIPVLVVAVAVVAVGVGVYGWLTATDQDAALPAVTPVVSTPVSSPTAAPTTTPSLTPSPSDTPSPTVSAKPSPTATAKPKPTKAAPAPVSRTYPVVVLNQTSVTGLAAQVAGQLEQLGWQVVGVGNWRGNVPATTVYYPPGQLAQAQQLARDLGADRVRPRVAGMRTDKLTAILNSRPS